MSANYLSVLIYLISMSPFSIWSLRKWCLLSRCLIILWKTGFLAIEMSLVLSHMRRTLSKITPKSVHMAPPAIQIVVVPTGVTVLLGLCNPPHSWTGMVGPSLPGFTIAPCVDSLLCYRSIRWPKSIIQDSPKI
jgi:hypothetical protein